MLSLKLSILGVYYYPEREGFKFSAEINISKLKDIISVEGGISPEDYYVIGFFETQEQAKKAYDVELERSESLDSYLEELEYIAKVKSDRWSYRKEDPERNKIEKEARRKRVRTQIALKRISEVRIYRRAKVLRKRKTTVKRRLAREEKSEGAVAFKSYLRGKSGWQSIIKHQGRKLSCGLHKTQATADKASIEASESIAEYQDEWQELASAGVVDGILYALKAKYKQLYTNK